MHDKRYNILYEDEWILVVDKPSGMLVIPTPKGEANTLTELLNNELDRRGISSNAHPCHRLDRETSGLVVYAKGKKTQQLMMEEFKRRNVKKIYAAFVQGAVEKSSDTINSPIHNRNKNRNESAITQYRIIEKRRGFTIVEVQPVTGRTNQIRIHFKQLGHPLVGESVYAFRKDYNLKFKRAALHARHIEFIHPITKKALSFTSPLPDDMEAFKNNN